MKGEYKVFNKVKSISLSDYYRIVNPKYIYLKLVPSTGIRNYNSSQLAALANEICKGLAQRIRIEDKKLIYEKQTSIKYVIYQSKREVAFYFIIAEFHKLMAIEKINMTWGNKVTIVEVEQEAFPALLNPVVYQLKYKYEDALSIKTDARTNTLLNAMLSGVDVLEEGDQVMVIFNLIPSKDLCPKGWDVYHSDMVERYQNGKSMYKDKFDKKNVVKFFALFLFNIVDCLIDTIKMLVNIEQNEAVTLSQIVSNRKELSGATKNKANTVIIDTQVVVLSSCEDKRKEELLGKSISSSFKKLSEDKNPQKRADNELVNQKVKKPYSSSNDYIKKVSYSNACVNRFSQEELQNGLCLPGAEILDMIHTIEHKTIIDRPVKEHLTKGLVCAGTAPSNAKKFPIFFPHDKNNLGNLPIVLVSGMGAGKSNAVARYAGDMVNKENSNVIVFDYNKNCELSRDIVYLAKKGTNIVNIDMCNMDTLEALANSENMITDKMNVYDIVENAQNQANALVNFINALNPDFELTAAMDDVVFSAATLVYCFNGKCMRDVFSTIFNHEVRVELIESLSKDLRHELNDDIDVLRTIDEKNRDGNVVGTKDVEGIRSRIKTFRKNGILKHMLNKDPKNNLNFVDLLNQKNTLICIKMPEKKFRDNTIKDVIVGFYLSRIWNAIQIRSDQDELNKVNIIIDEIHKLKMTTRCILPDMLVEARKFSARVIICTHYLEQLGKSLKPLMTSAHFMLLQGADTKNFKEIESKVDYSLEEFSNMKKYSAICLFKTGEGYSSIIVDLPPVIKILPMAENVKIVDKEVKKVEAKKVDIKIIEKDMEWINSILEYNYKQLLLPAPIDDELE